MWKAGNCRGGGAEDAFPPGAHRSSEIYSSLFAHPYQFLRGYHVTIVWDDIRLGELDSFSLHGPISRELYAGSSLVLVS